MARTAESAASQRRRIRDLLTGLAGALLAAVLLKWFCVEAYRIPSPSMQPTLLGSVEAGVYDHVLVDKLRYLVVDPARWDLAVFHAPLQQRDTFVKRLVGLPGERIVIAGGNLHVVEPGAGAELLRVLRRPTAVQEAMWREVHPARCLVRGEVPGLGVSLRGEPQAAWRAGHDDTVAALAPDRSARLVWTDADGGLVDRLWDGHPLPVAIALRAAHAGRSHLAEIVTDARVMVLLTAGVAPTRCAIAVDVWRPVLPQLRFAFELDAGKAQLVVRRDGVIAAASEATAFPWSEGVPVAITFAHLDDELIAWRDGVEIARLDAAAIPCREGCELPDPCGMGPAMPAPEQRVEASLELMGSGEVHVHELRIWRDQQWTRGPLAAGAVLVVPAEHYLLLGDNPLQSEDGRGFRGWTLGALDGAAVPPDTPLAAARIGNLLANDGHEPPGRDDNPIPLQELRLLVVRDRYGNVEALRGEVEFVEQGTAMRLRWHDAEGVAQERELPATVAHFVPRSALLGRALLRYWPLPPFGPFRVGWLR